MNLTEGQLFTIEALNRIEGFVWPDSAKFAAMDCDDQRVHFYRIIPECRPIMFASNGNYVTARWVGVNHPDWRNSLITREQFDSVDRWVRNDGSKPVISGDFDLLLADGEAIYFCDIRVDCWDWSVPCKGGVEITRWRHNKPVKETEMQQPKPYKKRDCIETLIDKRKDAIEQRRLALVALEEAEAKERELMLSIQAWAESYGFDIRVLDESDEAPKVEPKSESELAITDWRDLRTGDVIIFLEGYVAALIGRECKVVDFDCTHAGQNIEVESLDTGHRGWPIKWKFIRRPSK